MAPSIKRPAGFIVHLIACAFFVISAHCASAVLGDLPITDSVDDVAYDSFSRQLFVATISSNGVSRVALLNEGQPVSLGQTLVQGQGHALVEPDGIGGLYVLFQGDRTVVRHDIVTGTNSPAFSFGPAGMTAENIRVVSGQDRLISIVRDRGPGVMDSTLFQNGVALNPILYNVVRGVEPGGAHVYSSIAGVNKLKVTTNGFDVALAITNSLQGFNPELVVTSNRVVLGTGSIMDLDLRPVATVRGAPQTPFATPNRVYADQRTNLLVFSWHANGPVHLVVYDPATGGNKADIELPLGNIPTKIFPWGNDAYGIQWADGDLGKISIVDFSAVAPTDLSLTITPSLDVATNQQPLTYTVTLNNNGSAVENVTVFHEFTFGVVLNNASASAGQTTLWANTITWQIPALAAAQSATLTIQATANGPNLGVSETSVTFSGVDSTPGNNSVTNVIAIAAPLTTKGTTFQFPVASMIANPDTGDIYLTEARSNGPFPYSLLRWNPEKNTLEQVAAYPVAPSLVALSSDKRFIFVVLSGSGEIDQIDLAIQGGSLRFRSGFDAYVGDIDPLPESPESLVVASGFGSRIFDNGVPRPNAGPAGVVAVLNDNQALQYFAGTNPNFPKLNALSFDANGITATPLGNPQKGLSQIYAAGGRVFMENGTILDPGTGAVTATIDAALAPSWAFNEEADEFFILSNDSVKWTLKRYRLSTLQKVAEIPVPPPLEVVAGLVRFGFGKYAYKSANFVTAFIEPKLTTADVALTSRVTTPASGTSSEPFLWSLTVTNRGPDTASNIAVIAQITGPVQSIRPTDGNSALYPNPFTRFIPTLAPGESHTLTLSITPQNGGRFRLSGHIERFGADPDFSNNSLVEDYSLAPAVGIIRSYRIPVADIEFDKTSGSLLMTPMTFLAGLENTLVSLDLNSYSLNRIISFSSPGGAIATTSSDAAGFVTFNGNSAAPFATSGPFIGGAFPIAGIFFDMIVRSGTTNVMVESATQGTIIYTNGIPLQIATPGALAFDNANPDRLFVYHDQGVLSRFDLTSIGNAETKNRLTTGDLMPIVAANGTVIFSDGRMANEETLQLVGRLPGIATNQAAGQVAFDSAANRVYLYFHGQKSDRIDIFDAANFDRIGSMTFPAISKPGRFRVHNNRAALIDLPPNGWELYQVHVFDIPNTNQLDLTATGVAATAMEGVPTTLTVTASNNSPWTATNATVEVKFPANFTFESSPGTNTFEILNGAIRFNVSNLTSGAPNTLQMIGKFSGVATNTFQGKITSGETDVNGSNNEFAFDVVVVSKPSLNVTNLAVIEGSPLSLQFSLSHPVPVPVSFTLTFTNDTAQVEQVLQPSSNFIQTITFNPNAKTVSSRALQTVANTAPDAARSLTVLLSAATNVDIPASNVIVRILDDEGPPILSVLSVPTLVESSTNKTFQLRFTLNKPSTNDAHFQYHLVSESATAGVDFADDSATITIPAGTRIGIVPITVVADNIIEVPETFRVEVNAIDNVQILTEFVRLTINDLVIPVVSTDQIVDTRIDNGHWIVRFTSAGQGSCRLLRAPEIGSTDWTPIGDVTLHSTGIDELGDPQPMSNPQMFYRIERR